MIEELTPQVLASSMVLVLLCAPVITALLSALFMWRYRRAVSRTMFAPSGFQAINTRPSPEKAVSGAKESASMPMATQAPDFYRLANRSPWRDAAVQSLAVIAASVPLSLAAQVVYPTQLGFAGFMLGVCIYAWPMVPAAILILPRSPRIIVTIILGYFLVYAALAVWAGTISNIATQRFGGVLIPDRSGITPARMAILWFSVNAVPTVLCILCFNRAVRAIGGLVLALVTVLTSGLWFTWVWLFMPEGSAMLSWLAASAEVEMAWLALTLLLIAAGLLVMTGWCSIRAIARAYRRKTLSDRSLNLNAMFLVFLSMYGMWLVMGGLIWMACIPAAFAMYKLVLAIYRRTRSPCHASQGLCFLRVFALGRRSESLLEAVARYWRGIGSIQMIAGPDLATGTVQPHQFLDFLGGNLEQHFVSNNDSLTRAMAELDDQPDRDGRFRINSLFCYEDTWQAALPRLVQSGETVMMDLRGFCAENAGCQDELRFLALEVPLQQCLLIVDKSTDREFLQQTLAEALASTAVNSSNASDPPAQFRIFEFELGDTTVKRLVRVLCDTRPEYLPPSRC
jgi:hypothetical protein